MGTKKSLRRLRIKKSIRKRIFGTAEQPRLSVYRSNKAIYVQVIDDLLGKTLVTASSMEKDFASAKATKTELAELVGKRIAEKALSAGIKNIVFDRNGYLYHGRVKALAQGVREGGLKF